MAKIKVTKINFTDYLKEKVDDMGIEGLFMSSLLGGKEQLKEALLWCVVHLGGADKQTLGELLEELNKL